MKKSSVSCATPRLNSPSFRSLSPSLDCLGGCPLGRSKHDPELTYWPLIQFLVQYPHSDYETHIQSAGADCFYLFEGEHGKQKQSALP